MTDLSEQQLVLTRLLAAHEAYFDVARDYEFEGRTFAGYAEFHSSIEQYVLVKRAKLWEATAHEYIFFEIADSLDAASFDELVRYMKERAFGKVKPNREHMTSYVSLVVIAGSVPSELHRTIRKTKFRWNVTFGLQGWADLRIAVVDLGSESIITNTMGKELKDTLRANAFEASPAVE